MLLAGALCGAVLVFVVQKEPVQPEARMGQSVAVQAHPTVSHADVEKAPDSGFVDVKSIQDVLAQPTEFARLEALHVLAGRSNATRLQELISDGDLIEDRTVRDSTLIVLFKRLAEVDPQTALALARIEPYSKDDGFENAIWRIWARNDLEEAIFAVNTQTRRSFQEAAAQSLFAAYGYMGNETTDRLQEALGIEPDRQTRLRFLRTLLEDSPDRLIEYISNEPSQLRRNEYINWLAYALDTDDRSRAFSYAERFTSTADRALFKGVVEDRFARLNPVETLQQALANNNAGPGSDFFSALQELAATDIAAAMDFYQQIDAPQTKMMAAYHIAKELAGTNPEAALDWARSLDGAQRQQIEGAVLARIAEADPQFAISAAAALPPAQRTSAISNILMTVTNSDPSLALELLASLPEGMNKARMEGQIGQAWLMSDPTAATAWLKTLDKSAASRIAAGSVRLLTRSQPEMAYQLLALMDEPQRVRSVSELIGQFASSGDISRARALVDEFKGQKGFEGIETRLITGLARHDTETAKQLAFQLQDTKERSRVLSSIAASIAPHDPKQAVDLLQSITDPVSEKQAIQAIARQWHRSDPDAALSWVSSLPPGDGRDAAVVQLSMKFRDVGQRELELVNSITDPEARKSAEKMAIFRLARTDQSRALRMLEDLDIPEVEKAKYREQIENPRVPM